VISESTRSRAGERPAPPPARAERVWRHAAFVTLAAASTTGGCKDRPARTQEATARPLDAAIADAIGAWPELAELPSTVPVRVIAVPSRATAPRFDVGGPVLVGDLAVVASSQLGFAAVDFRRGQLVWTKPSGAHVAPPQIVGGNVVLIGDCVHPPEIPAGETLLGCVRVVTPTGADVAYVAIRGKQQAVAPFAAEPGAQHVWAAGSNVVWRRGEQAVSIDLISGVASPVPSDDPPLVVTYKDRTWLVRRGEDGILVAHQKNKEAWRTERGYDVLLGAVYIPEQAPMVRASSAIRHSGRPEILLFDMDATGSLHGQVSMNPVPGIGVTAHAIDAVGDVALAVRLDTSLQRDFIAGYAANASLIWTYALPQVPRADPIGVAIAHDAVVVFHDGDTVTVLPELSAPPTAPGAVKAPSENPTP
jgi:hypothetical protein